MQQNEINQTRDEDTRVANDIYLDPALAEQVSQDPIYIFLKKWWKQLLYFVLAVLGATYFYTSFEQAYEQNLEVSADYFKSVQSAYQLLEVAQREYNLVLKSSEKPEKSKDDKEVQDAAAKNDKLENAKKKLEAARNSFNQTLAEAYNQSRDPYKMLRDIYAVKLARLENNKEQLLAQAPVANQWQSIQDVESFARITSEYKALFIARSLLDMPDQVDSGKNILSQLVRSGEHAAVPAAVALADLGQNPEERKETLALLKELNVRSPEQSELLRDPIARLEEK